MHFGARRNAAVGEQIGGRRMTHDYIIAGAGAAGCVLANRLA